MTDTRLIIFDCDGVLVDSEIIAVRVEQGLLNAAGYDISAEQLITRFCGMNWQEILLEIERESGLRLSDNLLERTEQELDDRLAREVQSIDGVAAALDQIRLPCCVCSNSRMSRLQLMLGRTGLLPKFGDRVFSAQDLGPGRAKPRPDIFLHGAAQLGVAPSQAIVIEDSVPGVQAARAAGMKVLGFTGGAHSYPDHANNLLRAGAHIIVPQMRGLVAALDELADAQPAAAQ